MVVDAATSCSCVLSALLANNRISNHNNPHTTPTNAQRKRSPSAQLIGPNYTAYSNTPYLATEASGRRACTLSGTGDSLQVTLSQEANAFELRYSIPDAPQVSE